MPDNDVNPLKEIFEKLHGQITEAEKKGEEINIPKFINEVVDSFTKLRDSLGTTFGQFENSLGKISQLGIPFSKSLSESAHGISNLKSVFTDLTNKGVAPLGKAATALTGPAGIAATGVLILAKGILDFTKMMADARVAMAEMSASVGSFGDLAGRTRETFKLASELAGKFNYKLDATQKIIGALVSAGIEPSAENIKALIKDFTELQIGLGITSGTTQSVVKYLRQEYNVKGDELVRTLALIKGHKELNMTTDNYLQTVVNLARGMIDFGIGAYSISKNLRTAVTEIGLGAERAQTYVKEMMMGPRQAGLGQRAFLAERLGVGGGNVLSGAAQIGYGMQPAMLGKEVIKMASREMGFGNLPSREEMKKGTNEQWGMGAQIAQFAKQFGVNERTVYEELGLPVKKQLEPLESMAGDAKEMSGKMTGGLKVISESRYFLQKIEGWMQKQYLGFAGKSEKEQLKLGAKGITELMKAMPGGGGLGYATDILLNTTKANAAKKESIKNNIEKKHMGGSLSSIPRFHDGVGPNELMAILDKREGVVNQKGMQTIGEGGLNKINQGGALNNIQINVSVLIPILKQAIEDTVKRILNENPNVIAMG
ncbi:MAG: hypothetical protein PHP92_04880 [Candidatus Nanoarchaeia archaeon]|nr:hypothetical protein [Candidatus Nanoarchaeia archaeon]